MPLQIRRGNTAERLAITPLPGELIFDTQTNKLYIGNSTGTAGGVVAAGDVAGNMVGNLNLNGFDITGSGNISVTGSLTINGETIVGTGVVEGSTYKINIAADDSTIMLNATNETVTATGGLFGPIFTNLIDSADSSAITVTPATTFETNVTVQGNGIFNDIVTVGTSMRGPNIELTHDDPTARLLGLTHVTNDALGASVILRKSRGTIASNTVVVSNDILSSITAQGYDGSAYQISSRMIQRAAGTVTGGRVPGNIEFYTTNNSGTLQKRLECTYDGFVNVGGNVDVTGNVVIGGYFAATNEVSGARMLDLIQHTTDTTGVTLALKKGRGTLTSPTVVVANDIIGSVTAQGYDGAAFQTSSRIVQRASGTVASGIVPGSIELYTTNNSGSSSLRVTVDHTGLVETTGAVTVGGNLTTNSFVRFDNTTYTTGSYVLFRQYHNNADASNVTFARYRGTSAAPTVIQTNDKVGDLTWAAYDGASLIGMAGINATVTGAVGTNSMPSRMQFLLHDGTSNAVRLTLNNDGLVSFTGTGLVAGGGSGEVNTASVATYMKINFGGTDYAIPLYAINP